MGSAPAAEGIDAAARNAPSTAANGTARPTAPASGRPEHAEHRSRYRLGPERAGAADPQGEVRFQSSGSKRQETGDRFEDALARRPGGNRVVRGRPTRVRPREHGERTSHLDLDRVISHPTIPLRSTRRHRTWPRAPPASSATCSRCSRSGCQSARSARLVEWACQRAGGSMPSANHRTKPRMPRNQPGRQSKSNQKVVDSAHPSLPIQQPQRLRAASLARPESAPRPHAPPPRLSTARSRHHPLIPAHQHHRALGGTERSAMSGAVAPPRVFSG
jgi:hypothetical protein